MLGPPEAVSFQGSMMHKPSTLSLTHRVNAPALARLVVLTELAPVLQYLPCIQGPKLNAVSRSSVTSSDQSRITLFSRLCFYSQSPGCYWWSWLPGYAAGQHPPCAHQHLQVLLTQTFLMTTSRVQLPCPTSMGSPATLPVQDLISAQPGSVSPCSEATAVPGSSPPSAPLLPSWSPQLCPGPRSSLAMSESVSGPHYDLQGTVPHGRRHGQHWASLSSSSQALGLLLGHTAP